MQSVIKIFRAVINDIQEQSINLIIPNAGLNAVDKFNYFKFSAQCSSSKAHVENLSS